MDAKSANGQTQMTAVLPRGKMRRSTRSNATVGMLAAAMAGLLAGVAPVAAFAASQTLAPTDFNPKQLVGKGPFGEAPASPDDVKLTPEELAKVKAGNFKVAIAMQTMDIDYSKILLAAMLDTFKKAGVQVIAQTDAAWKPEKQIGDIENLMEQHPDGILSVPTDGVATAATYAKVSGAGIKLVLIDTVPKGLTYPKSFQSAVGPDQAGIGEVAANLLATRIRQGGTVGMINFDIDLWATNERTRGAREWFAAHRPDIKIKTSGFQDPAKAGQIGSDFLIANPDIQGVWIPWDAPTLEVISAMRGAGNNLPIATDDLGLQIARDIAQGANVIGVGAQRLADQGRADANAMMKILIGESAPAYIAVPALTVTKENLTDGYRTVWNEEPKAGLVSTCKKTKGCK